MEKMEMTPEQIEQRRALESKVRTIAGAMERMESAERRARNFGEKLELHERYLDAMTMMVRSNRGDVCRGEEENPLWRLRNEAEKELYAFDSKLPSFNDIPDHWEHGEGLASMAKRADPQI